MVRWCWVNFQCRGVLLLWITVGQGPTALAVGAGGGCLDIFTLIYRFSFLSPSLWETARYRLKYCLKGPLSPNQPTNQPLNAISLQVWSQSSHFFMRYGASKSFFNILCPHLTLKIGARPPKLLFPDDTHVYVWPISVNL